MSNTTRVQLDVTDECAGERLDRFLAERASASGHMLSRTRLKALILGGHVLIGGRPVADPSFSVQSGDRIELDIPPPQPAEPKAERIALNIVFEDAHLLVLDKPAGLVVHPAAGHDAGTLVNALIAHCGESLSGIGGVKRPGIVHRLDKDTSGLLVVAKTDAAHRGLAALFADHGRSGSLVRTYHAFVWGAPERSGGTIDAPIGRHSQSREKMAVVGDGRGRPAVTHWAVMERFDAIASLIACRLETGRTHQIRVHLAGIGHPLLGDSVYGAGFKSKAAHLTAAGRNALGELGRQALHAAVLGFQHPITGEMLALKSPLPPDLERLAAALCSVPPPATR
ncbi:MAG: RluA family pseudouridine synthase [Methylobacteriaceae bacterium]|nr:RluA family pseudouridine synthase [Methylobacteriaceae bacterium]